MKLCVYFKEYKVFILQKRSYSWEQFRIMLTRMLIEELISSYLESTFKVQGQTSLFWGGEETWNMF